MKCHTGAAGFALGAEIAQLNKEFTYPSTGRKANQLETIDHVMTFSGPLPGPASSLDALDDPNDTGLPPLGSTVIDTSNVVRIAAWIDGLASCD